MERGRVAFITAFSGFLLLTVASCSLNSVKYALGPPKPAEILKMPSGSGIKDAHVTITGHAASGAFSANLSGEGVMILQPKAASDIKLTANLGTIPIAVEYLDADGKSYQRTGTDKWVESKPSSSDPGSWADGKDPNYLGEDTVLGSKAWHVKAKDAQGGEFELWVREDDGYPVKLSGGSGSANFTMTFDRFNTGGSVSAPSKADIKPPAKNLTGKVGNRLALNGSAVSVVSFNPNFTNPNEFITPKTGSKFVVIEVLYENTGSDKISYSPSDWKATDASAFSYDGSFSGQDPALQSGDLNPGEKARGFITYEVPISATGLKVKVTVGDDTATFSLQ
jgi:hypothetical protein